MSDVIAEKKAVTLEYVLHDKSGSELDRSKPDKPLVYLHGASNIVPGLEEQLAGQSVGAELKAVVPPEKGYGVKRRLKPLRMPRSKFPADADIKVGAQFVTRTEQGMLPLWITKIQGPTVVCTAEHPLAGVELHFSVKVLEIRDATDEEVEHGHVHGPGGHEHD